jgi:membrane-bound ClpP family serine protease
MPIFSPLAGAVVAAGLLLVVAGLLFVVAGLLLVVAGVLVVVVVVLVVVLLLALLFVVLLLLVSPPPHAVKPSATATHIIRGRNFLSTYFYSSKSGPALHRADPDHVSQRLEKRVHHTR